MTFVISIVVKMDTRFLRMAVFVGTSFTYPNLCGESFVQEGAENHWKTCRVEEIT